MRSKKTKFAIGILSTIVIIWIIYNSISNDSNIENPITTEVKQGSFTSLVYSSGQLQAQNSVSINAPTELSQRTIRIYEIKITKLIEEGTVVDSGDFVASLDHSAVEERLNEELTQLSEKMEAYEDAKVDTNINLSNLRDELITSRIDLEEKELILQQSIYESPAVKRQAQLNLDKAERKLEQDLRNYELKKKQNVINVNRSYSEVESAQRRINDIERLLETIEIKAPAPGMLIYTFDRTGNKRKVGSVVSRWDPIIAELPDLSSMISKTFINEADISKIKTGQKVKVGVDAFPEKMFDGEVIEVANIGQVIPGGDSKVFEVIIKINGNDGDLRPAMTTSNIITTNQIDTTLYIPLEAVFEDDSLTYVYTYKGSLKRQIVELGDENENFVIVKQGLREGQEILLNEPQNSEEFELEGLEIYKAIKQKQQLDAKTDSLSAVDKKRPPFNKPS